MDFSFLAGHALVRDLSPEEAARLARHAKETRFAMGERLFTEDSATSGLFFVREGLVKVSKRGKDGAERELAKLNAPTVLGEMEVVSGGKSAATVTAECDVVAFVIPHAVFYQLIASGESAVSKIMRNIAAVVVARLAETNARLASANSSSARAAAGEEMAGFWPV